MTQSVEIGGVSVSQNALLEGFGEDRRTLFLFGAGHVGRALVLALAPLPFRVVWIDPRPDAFPSHVPGNVSCVSSDDPAAVLATAPDGSFVIVLTHSHALDQAIVDVALRDPRHAYVGLIGSGTKRARFMSRLAEAGVTGAELERLVCPIGIPGVKSKLPAVIAASVAADLLLRDERCRQAKPDAGARFPVLAWSGRGRS